VAGVAAPISNPHHKARAVTLQEYINAFEAEKQRATAADNLCANPMKWGIVRGIRAVVALAQTAEREACLKAAENAVKDYGKTHSILSGEFDRPFMAAMDAIRARSNDSK
jgi:hypothetical protein